MDLRTARRAAGAEQVGGLAIRQPAIIYLLQRELWSKDGDAFAAGLELASRVIGEATILAGGRLPRLPQRELTAALEAVRLGGCERQTVRWIRDQIDQLPVVLTRAEEDAVATAIAAVLWAVSRTQLPGQLIHAAARLAELAEAADGSDVSADCDLSDDREPLDAAPASARAARAAL
jgi:hypothetical protein